MEVRQVPLKSQPFFKNLMTAEVLLLRKGKEATLSSEYSPTCLTCLAEAIFPAKICPPYQLTSHRAQGYGFWGVFSKTSSDLGYSISH